MREVAELARRVAELERRQANNFRHGTVEQVDAKRKLVRIRLGEDASGKPFIGPWVPYAQIAGALKLHSPPSKGQQMTMLNPTGDFRQAVAIPLTWSDQNKSPSDSPDEHVLTFGDFTFTLTKDRFEIKVGGAKFVVTKDDIFAEVGDKRLGVSSGAVYSVKLTRLGLDEAGEKDNEFPKAVTEAGPAKQVEAKV